ncbi:hypothetical protein BU24DRAFT_275390 [Aaosphaeria arxii CBS 175.79]|uniref:Uncharacterized protein n=1 Tax=Aaosphaeria arxii CBS 175.79 TaxID=1450172 RepID=A0A6A5XHV9_9PLEO|nr:uncharacterized protein BU24DRAFT_275390 [Aaosphaeria arxii CBS 175.79]KAF2012360.1 hypothetical protein BU24DRAFT_275390 [Aaosphaeria arxii CBS 175.79]
MGGRREGGWMERVWPLSDLCLVFLPAQAARTVNAFLLPALLLAASPILKAIHIPLSSGAVFPPIVLLVSAGARWCPSSIFVYNTVSQFRADPRKVHQKGIVCVKKETWP